VLQESTAKIVSNFNQHFSYSTLLNTEARSRTHQSCFLGTFPAESALQSLLHAMQISAKKSSSGSGFGDQNNSWLKRKQQEDDSEQVLADGQDSDSEGTLCHSKT